MYFVMCGRDCGYNAVIMVKSCYKSLKFCFLFLLINLGKKEGIFLSHT